MGSSGHRAERATEAVADPTNLIWVMPAEGSVDVDDPVDIVVVAGGRPMAASAVGRARARSTAGTPVVAADAGLLAARAAGWPVAVAVGDFDSVPAEVVDHLDDLAAEIHRHPRDKDATDLELALDVAVSRTRAEGRRARVLVCGLEGGRPDHALANLLALAGPATRDVDVVAALDLGLAVVVRDVATARAAPPGRLLTVLPVHGPATVSLAGVRWPLDHHRLEPGSTRGVSNVVDGPVRLDVHDGVALLVLPDPEPDPHPPEDQT